MAKEYKNNIIDVLKHIENKDYDYFDSLTEEQKKELQPYILMRWMATVKEEQLHQYYTLAVNELVNINFWDLSKYKDLQFKLLCAVGQKEKVFHQWLASSKSSKDKDLNDLKPFFKNLNEQELKMKLARMTKEEKTDVRNFLGLNNK